LITGQLQSGDNAFAAHPPAQVNVAGDPDDSAGPTYATFAALLNRPPAADGALLVQRVDRAGNVTLDETLAAHNATAAHRVSVSGIDHQVASPFWSFMNAAGAVWQDGGYATAPLFPDPFYATGYPLSEAYWATVRVGGVAADALLQCFERRCLTWTPGTGWQVEAGNVGAHYYQWRYVLLGFTPVIAPPPSTGDVRITFVNFDPPGDEKTDEHVDIRNADVVAIQLRGWKLQDESGDSFTFPDFLIAPGATLRVHNCDGANSGSDIYTGRCSAWWNNASDTASLYDATGALIDSYSYD
jgi:hypothetical protein